MARNRNDQRNYSDVDQRRHPYRNRDNEETRRSGEFYNDHDEDYGDYNRQASYDMDSDDYFDGDYEDNMGGQYDDRNRSFSSRYDESYDGERNSGRRGYREFQPTDNRRNYMSHPRQEGVYQSNEYGHNRGDSSWGRDRNDDMDDNRRSDWGRNQNQERQYSRRGFASNNYRSSSDNDSRYGYGDQRYGQNDQRYSGSGQRYNNGNSNNRNRNNDQRYGTNERRMQRGSQRRDY